MPVRGGGANGWAGSHFDKNAVCRHHAPGDPLRRCEKKFANKSNSANLADHVRKCHPEHADKQFGEWDPQQSPRLNRG
jgi:hypothetical protein